MNLSDNDRNMLTKVFNLGLHPQTCETEWQASAIAAFRIFRRLKFSTEYILGEGTKPGTGPGPRYYNAKPREEEKKDYGDTRDGSNVIGFGKYKGKTVREVARIDLRYLEWVLAKLTKLRPMMRQEIAREVAKRQAKQQYPPRGTPKQEEPKYGKDYQYYWKAGDGQTYYEEEFL